MEHLEETQGHNSKMILEVQEYEEKLKRMDEQIKQVEKKLETSQEEYKTLTTDKESQQRELLHSSLVLHRELKALGSLNHGYRQQIRQLNAMRAKSENLRAHFEELERQRRIRATWKKGLNKTRIIMMSNNLKADPATVEKEEEAPCPEKVESDASLKLLSLRVQELEHSVQLEQQMLLLRNNRLVEYENSISECSTGARLRLSKTFITEYSMLEKELVELENYIHMELQDLLPIAMNISKSSVTRLNLQKYLRMYVNSSTGNVEFVLGPLLHDMVKLQIIDPIPDTVLWKEYRENKFQLMKRPRVFSQDELIECLDELWCDVLQEERSMDRSDEKSRGNEFIRPLDTLLIEHLRAKYVSEDATVRHVLFSILAAVETYAGENAQINLFCKAYCSQVEQCAWRYFYCARTCITAEKINIDSPKMVKEACGLFLPRATERHSFDRVVAIMISRFKDKITTDRFFEWLASAILSGEELRLQRISNELRRRDTELVHALGLSAFSEAVLQSISVPRGLIARYFNYVAGESEVTKVPIHRLLYIIAYMEMKECLLSSGISAKSNV